MYTKRIYYTERQRWRARSTNARLVWAYPGAVLCGRRPSFGITSEGGLETFTTAITPFHDARPETLGPALYDVTRKANVEPPGARFVYYSGLNVAGVARVHRGSLAFCPSAVTSSGNKPAVRERVCDGGR